MRWLPDSALDRLRAAAPLPELAGHRYRVIEPIARGGMGVVYRTEDTALGREVALKVLDLPDDSGELTARLAREARILARLEHPGIVPVHDVGETVDGRIFYTMKLVRGHRLDEWLAEPRSLADKLRLFVRVCEPVAFAHAHGVLHRDLKPENIMVGPFGEVLVMDWGVAKVLPGASGRSEAPTARWSGDGDGAAEPPATVTSSEPVPVTEHGAVLGTPGFMAPEQERGLVGELDERADVYSLGAVLALLLGPEASADRDAGRPGRALPKRLGAIVRKARAASPAERYAGARELARDLERFLDGRPVGALPEGPLVRAARFLGKHRVAVILLVVYIVVRILAAVFLGR